MIRRISSLALGIAFVFTAASAFAEEAAEGGGGEEKPAEEAKPAEGGGDAKAGGSAAVSTDNLPKGKGAFGKSGQIAISSDFALGFQSISSKPKDGDAVKATRIEFGPALDYFVIDGVSVGGQIEYSSLSVKDGPTTSNIGIGPRVGYNLGLTDNISIWPKLGLSYNMGKTEQDVAGTTVKTDTTKMTVGVMVPVLFHPAEHFFIGLGPVFSMDMTSKVKPDGGDEADGNKDTVIGLDSVVGGWF
ncbi:MAG: hypothetical protein L6Q84_27170 [Polyangiaceae bacterium]|nr:hypothetical protein [Polyangiaceae bacterium]